MQTITITTNGDKAIDAMVNRVKQRASPAAMDRIIGTLAAKHFGELKKDTPKKFTGSVASSWRLNKVEDGHWRIHMPEDQPSKGSSVSTAQIMIWIEIGRGPVMPVKAKALFIPLTSKAFNTYHAGGDWESKGSRRMMSIDGKKRKVARLNRAGRKVSPLKYGIDYVLAKSVRASRPRFIVALRRALIQDDLRKLGSETIKKALAG
jgi:hypothetical protein